MADSILSYLWILNQEGCCVDISLSSKHYERLENNFCIGSGSIWRLRIWGGAAAVQARPGAPQASVLCLFIQQEGSWEIKTSKFYILTHTETEFQNLSRARVIYAAQFKIVTCGMCVVCLFWSHSEVKLDKVGMTQQLSVAALKWLMRRPLMILMSLSSSLIILMIRSLTRTQVKAAGPAPGLVSTLCVAATWRDVI